MEKAPKKKESKLSNTIATLEGIRAEISNLKKMEEELKDALVSIYKDQIDTQYKEKPEPFGIVRLGVSDDTDVVFDTPKKVKWDQKGLKELFLDGAPVKVEYSLSETLFKELNEAGKKAFMPYRTVEPGKITVKIERKEN